jgi:hypothetical protein
VESVTAFNCAGCARLARKLLTFSAVANDVESLIVTIDYRNSPNLSSGVRVVGDEEHVSITFRLRIGRQSNTCSTSSFLWLELYSHLTICAVAFFCVHFALRVNQGRASSHRWL